MNKRISVRFTQEERVEVSKVVVPELVKSLSDVDILISKDILTPDQIYDIIYNKILEVIMKYDSLYKRLSIVNSVYTIGQRLGHKYAEFMLPRYMYRFLSPSMYSKLFDHKFLAEDDFNDYDPSSLNTIEAANKLAATILNRSSYDYASEGYYGTWRDLGKCKTCDRHVTLDYGQFYRYYDKLHPKYNKHFPVHCIHCRTLKKMKKEYKLTHHRADGKPLDDIAYEYIKKNKKKIKKRIDSLTKTISQG